MIYFKTAMKGKALAEAASSEEISNSPLELRLFRLRCLLCEGREPALTLSSLSISGTEGSKFDALKGWKLGFAQKSKSKVP